MQERRTVTLCEHTPANPGVPNGRGPKLWAFGYAALAKLLGMKEGAVRQAVSDERLDPADLEMVCESWMRYHPYKARSYVSDLDWRMKEEMTARTAEERKLLAELRASRKREPTRSPEENFEDLKRQCREAPVVLAQFEQSPADLTKARLEAEVGDTPEAQEVQSIINARCAAGERDVVEAFDSTEEAYLAGLAKGRALAAEAGAFNCECGECFGLQGAQCPGRVGTAPS